MAKLPCGKIGQSCLDVCQDKKSTNYYENNKIEECYHSYVKRQRNKVELPNGLWIDFKDADLIKKNIKNINDYIVNEIESTVIKCPFCFTEYKKLSEGKHNCKICYNTFGVAKYKNNYKTKSWRL